MDVVLWLRRIAVALLVLLWLVAIAYAVQVAAAPGPFPHRLPIVLGVMAGIAAIWIAPHKPVADVWLFAGASVPGLLDLAGTAVHDLRRRRRNRGA